MKKSKKKDFLVAYVVTLSSGTPVFRNTIIRNADNKESVYNYFLKHPEIMGGMSYYSVAILNIMEL